MDFTPTSRPRSARCNEHFSDHHYLNDVPGLENPDQQTALAGSGAAGPVPAQLAEVVVHETCTSGCRYRGPAWPDSRKLLFHNGNGLS